MKVVAQMDEISSINPKTDTTFLILLEAQNLGHEIFYYTPKHLNYQSSKQEISASVKKIKLQKSQNFYKIVEEKKSDLREFDVILVRQDPPFDMSYITTTYLLEKIKNHVLVLNDPSEIRNCPEKIFVTNFQDLTPPTLITSELNSVLEFQKVHTKIIIKPLYAFGGESVLMIENNDNNLATNFEMMIKIYKSPLIAQKFIPEIKNGDKRIFLLDGKPIGAISRIAKDGEIRSNLHIGGKAQKASLSKRDLEICKTISPFLQEKNLFLVGIDVIGDYLTEINVTSPTCIPEINQQDGVKLENLIVNEIEQKLLKFKRK